MFAYDFVAQPLLNCIFSYFLLHTSHLLNLFTVGTCEPYTGSVCSSYILKDTRVSIPSQTTQRQSEDNIVLAASTLTDYINPTCKKSLLKALCYNLFLPCQSSKQAQPIQLCKDECLRLQYRTCSREFRLLKERLDKSLVEEFVPNCAGLTKDCLSKWIYFIERFTIFIVMKVDTSF